MSDLNQSILIGRIVRDAKLAYTTNGKAVTKFSLAVNKKRKDGDVWKDKADFFDLTLWGQLGESLHQYLTKGKQIAVIGELTQERWEQDGQNKSRVTITVQSIQLLGGNSNNSASASSEDYSPPTAGGDDSYQDDIPF
jgi:single-strand DNA-binding protein